MTLAAPINRQVIEDALHDWLADVTGIDVIWANQKAPTPARPYATLRVLSQRGIGHDAVEIDGEPADPVEGAEVEIAARGIRHLVVSVNTYSDSNAAATDARALMDLARAGLELETPLAMLREAGLAVVDPGAILSLDELVQGAWRSRCQMDVTFSVASNATERVGFIAEVEVTSEALGLDEQIFTVTEV